eukprot:2101352-Amphidinium_carterae.1
MGNCARRRRNTEAQDRKRASGQELEDAGGIKLKGRAESGKTVLMNMPLTEVHKPLASAHRALRQHVAFLTGTQTSFGTSTRNGVYNLYVQPSADLSAIETASAVSAGLSGNQAASAAHAGLSEIEAASAVGAGLKLGTSET